jgi:hypothetical protein
MPTLQEKYAELITAAQATPVSNLAVRAQDNVLYIDGVVPTGEAKDKLWGIYDKIDPDFRSGDLILNLDVSPAAPSTRLKVTTRESNLNIRKGHRQGGPQLGGDAPQQVQRRLGADPLGERGGGILLAEVPDGHLSLTTHRAGHARRSRERAAGERRVPSP